MGGLLDVGVIGLGFGANHARILHEMPGVRLAALCDPDPRRLAVAAAGTLAATYADFEAMLSGPSLDAVVVVVPALLHEAVGMAAIRAGCAVMIEKPLAPSLAAARRLAGAASDAGVPLMTGHIERFNPAIEEVLRLVEAGAVGRVVQVNARRLAYFVSRPRVIDVGVVQDLALHDIDILCALMGTEVAHVYAETYGGIRTPYDDGVAAFLRFERKGDAPPVVANLEVNWLSPQKVRQLNVLGDSGLLSADYADFRNPRLQFQAAQTFRRPPVTYLREGESIVVEGEEPAPAQELAVERHEPLVSELRAFVEAVRAGRPMPVTAEDALRALAIADALSESARTGRPVTPERP